MPLSPRRSLSVCVSLLAAASVAACAARVRVVEKGTLARYTKAAVASADPLASQAAARVLADGGNAMDAAVACALVLGVVEPHSAGIGGGGFLMFLDAKTGRVRALDYRERAPRKAHRDLYKKDGKVDTKAAVTGHLAVAVPGAVKGLFEAHKAHGRLPWARVVAPAVSIAREGFPLRPRVAEVMKLREAILRRYPATIAAFFPNGALPRVGDRMVQPDLADTLALLAKEGPAPFYEGVLAQKIAAEIAKGGGILDAEDLRGYTPVWREPVRGTYEGTEVVAFPPPSSGGVHLLQILRMTALRGVDPKKSILEYTHALAEAMRRAYADRAQFLGDPGFVKVPVRGLLDERYLKERAATIDPAKATPSAEVRAGDAPRYESRDTTHLSVVDAEGNAVTLTQSINYLMGASVVVPGTGILLNDTMDDFAAAPGTPNVFGLVGGEANAIAGKKTPLSSMTPTFVLRGGKLWLALGSPGGSTIITAVTNVLLNRVLRGMDLAGASNAARIHQQWLPDRIEVESQRPGMTKELLDGLRARGHTLKDQPVLGNVQAVEVGEGGERRCVADVRRDGACAGY